MSTQSAPFKKARAAAFMVRAILGQGWRVHLWTNVKKSDDAWHAVVQKVGVSVHLEFTRRGEYFGSSCLISSSPQGGGGDAAWSLRDSPCYRCPKKAVAAAISRVDTFVRRVLDAQKRIHEAYASPPFPEGPYLLQEDCNDGREHQFPYAGENVEQYCQECWMQDTTIAAARKHNKAAKADYAKRLSAHKRLIAPLQRKQPKG